MAQKTAARGIVLVDDLGREIDPEHVRLAFAGDAFFAYFEDIELGTDEELPPQHAEFEVTVRGRITGGVQMKELAEPAVWVVMVKAKIEDIVRSTFRIVAPPPPGPDTLEGSANGNGKAKAKS